MSNKDLKLAVNIGLKTSGVNQLEEGIKTLKESGAEVEGLESSIQELDKAYRKLGNEQNLIDNFKRLKEECNEVETAISEQEKEIKRLAKTMSNSPTRKMVSDFEKAKRAAKGLKTRQASLGATLQKTRTELSKNGISTKKLAEAQKRLNTKTKYLQNTTAGLGDKLKAARKEITKTTQANTKLEKTTGGASSKLGGLGVKAGVAGVALTALVVAAKKIVTEFTEIDAKFDSMERAFTQITGSADTATVEMDRMIDVANRLGISFSDVSNGYTGFLASAKGANIAFSESSTIFEQTAAKVLAMGGSTAEVNGVLLAFSQILSKGVVSTEELNQIAERLPGTFNFAADAMGVTTGELRDLIATGKVASNDFLPKFVDQLKQTGDIQETNAQTSAKLRNEWELFVKSLDDSMGISDGVQDSMGGLTEAIKLMRHEAEGNIDLIPDGTAENIKWLIPSLGVLSTVYDHLGEKISKAAKEQNLIGDANEKAKKTTDALVVSLKELEKARQSGDKKKIVQAEKDLTEAKEKQTEAYVVNANAISKVEEGRAKKLTEMRAKLTGLTEEQNKAKESLELMTAAGHEGSIAHNKQAEKVAALTNKVNSLNKAIEITNKVEVGTGNRALEEKTAKVKELNTALADQQKSLRDLKNEFAYLDAFIGKSNGVSKELTNTHEELTKAIKNQQTVVDATQAALVGIAPEYTKVAKAAEKSKEVLEDYSTGSVEEMQKFRDAAKAAGMSVSEIMTGISDSESKTIGSLKETVTQIESMGGTAQQTGERIERYLNGALKGVNRAEGIKAAISQLESLKEKNPAVVEQIGKLKESLNNTNSTFKKIADNVERATSVKQLVEFKEAAKKAFDEGAISAEQYGLQVKAIAKNMQNIQKTGLTESMKKNAETTKETTDSVKDNTEASKENSEAIKENAEETDKASESTGAYAFSFGKSAKALEVYHETFNSIDWHGNRGFLVAQARAVEAAVAAQEAEAEALRATGEASANLNEKMKDGTLTMADVESASAAAGFAIEALNEADLKDLNNSIDSAKQKLQSLEDKARSVAQSVADRLADATGDADDKINRKFEREIENIREQQTEANGVGNGDYERAIADLEKLKQVELEKQQERKRADAKREAERASKTSTSRGQGVNLDDVKTVIQRDYGNDNSMKEELHNFAKHMAEELDKASDDGAKKAVKEIRDGLRQYRNGQGR